MKSSKISKLLSRAEQRGRRLRQLKTWKIGTLMSRTFPSKYRRKWPLVVQHRSHPQENYKLLFRVMQVFK